MSKGSKKKRMVSIRAKDLSYLAALSSRALLICYPHFSEDEIERSIARFNKIKSLLPGDMQTEPLTLNRWYRACWINDTSIGPEVSVDEYIRQKRKKQGGHD